MHNISKTNWLNYTDIKYMKTTGKRSVIIVCQIVNHQSVILKSYNFFPHRPTCLCNDLENQYFY